MYSSYIKWTHLVNLCCIARSRLQEISVSVNSDKTEFMCFNQDGAISSLNCKPLKLVDPFIFHGSNISSTENDVNIGIGKV